MVATFRRFKLALFVALRLVRSRRSPALSLVTVISIVGICVGVFALNVVMAVTNGFQHAFEERILGLHPHLLVLADSEWINDYDVVLEQIRGTEGVVGATPVSTYPMMLSNGVFRSGATIQGVALDSVAAVVDIPGIVVEGSLDALDAIPTARVEGGELLLEPPVADSVMTVLIRDGAPPAVLVDDRTVPDAGQVRIKALDLRSGPRRPLRLEPRGGEVIDLYNLDDPIILPPPDGDAPAYTRELEVAQGTWELMATGQVMRLDEGTVVTLVLRDGAGGAGTTADVWMMVEPGSLELPERIAALRTIDARASGPPLPFRVVGADAPTLTSEAGSFTELQRVAAEPPGVLLGKALAEKLRAGVGDVVTLVSPLRGIDNKMVGPFGMLPSDARFKVAGVFESGFYEHDSKFALVDLAVIHRFLNRGDRVQAIAVRGTGLAQLDVIKARVGRALNPLPFEELVTNTAALDAKLDTLVQPGFSPRPAADAQTFVGGLRNVSDAVNLLKFQGTNVRDRRRFRIFDWKEKNDSLFRALELQKVVLSMFFLIIIVVASFVVVGSQIMVVHEKTADIAILKAMGATRGFVRLVFTLQGLFVALLGAFAGVAVSLGFIWLIDVVDYELEASIYLIDRLPARVDAPELLLVVVASLLCTLATTQISAGRAAGKTPVEGLRAID